MTPTRATRRSWHAALPCYHARGEWLTLLATLAVNIGPSSTIVPVPWYADTSKCTIWPMIRHCTQSYQYQLQSLRMSIRNLLRFHSYQDTIDVYVDSILARAADEILVNHTLHLSV
jgi:hypothetical protein